MNIKNNKALLDNAQRAKAYNDVLAQNGLTNAKNDVETSLHELAQQAVNNVDYIGNPPTLKDKLVTGFKQFGSGFNENLRTPFNPDNLAANPDKTIGNRLGEALGSATRFLDSPLGRGLLMGGISAASGASGLETLRYGLGAGVLNQNARSSDRLYRQELIDAGYPKEYVNSIKGYINEDMFNNFVNADYKHTVGKVSRKLADIKQQEADTDSIYKTNKINTENAKNFVQADEYYKKMLEQGYITEDEYKKIVEATDYDPYALINLNAINTIVEQQNANSRAKKTADDIKNNKQKRYYRSKNDGKNIVKVEYGEKPPQHSVVDVNYHGQKPFSYQPSPSTQKKKSDFETVSEKYKPRKIIFP